MKFVPLSDTTLRLLVLDDPWLKRVFQGVIRSDHLPRHPSRTTRAAYIVNTDLTGEPGRHWLGLWKENEVCEVLDSYSLPLTTYDAPDLMDWLDQPPHWIRSERTLQALNSAACGYYALMFVKDRVRGHSMLQFVQSFSPVDLVTNDRRVGQSIRQWIVDELPGSRQSNVTHRQTKPLLS